ncbi:MAG: hypothetical protein ABIR67_10260 [Gaiellaceae bacterium]
MLLVEESRSGVEANAAGISGRQESEVSSLPDPVGDGASIARRSVELPDRRGDTLALSTFVEFEAKECDFAIVVIAEWRSASPRQTARPLGLDPLDRLAQRALLRRKVGIARESPFGAALSMSLQDAPAESFLVVNRA